ncbi:hypothetical protein HOV04_gp60 [Xanthomonas phage XcP1]|uniref:Uncharacterized protein n=1 Tax=Xanthomonas phage XcP1 TaxID=2785027 RepID=A0A3S7L8N0_9CAUD|nr:hypothetical protein HOV04_gp60 [Xanthomonas phage XcP1]AWN08562.1 hypothetical protein XcP1_060 [Xanthomonas phage XcP1]
MTVDELIAKLQAESDKGRGSLQVRYRDWSNTNQEWFEGIDCVDVGEDINSDTIITLV